MVIGWSKFKPNPVHFWKSLSRKGKLAVVLIFLFIVAVSGYLIWNKTKVTSVVPQTSVKVEKGSIRVTVNGSGPVAAAREHVFKAPGESTVKEILFKEGDLVEAGQAVMVLDSPLVEAQAAKSLGQAGQAQAELNELKRQMDELNYRAPYPARITSLKVNPGDRVAKGTAILSLVHGEKATLNIPSGEVASLVVPGNKISLNLLEYGGTLTGTIAGSGSPYTNNGKNLISFPLSLNSGSILQNDSLVTATITTAQGEREISGVLKPAPALEVKAAADGIVKDIYVQGNDTVAENTLLFSLDSPGLEAQYQAKLASLKEAELNQADSAIKLQELVLTAPFTGIYHGVVDNTGPKNTFLQVGDSVSTNQNLGKIVSQDSVQVSFTVDELDIMKVKIGQKAKITADALKGKEFTGEVVRIAQEGIVQNGVAFYWVTVEVKDWQGLLLGMTADVEIVVAEKEDALVLPITAVQDFRGKKYVLLKDSSRKKENRAAAGQREMPENAVPVEIGMHNENLVEIVRGLEAGQEVLLPEIKRPINNSGAAVPRMGVPIPAGGRPPGR